MARYHYKALTPRGEMVTGTIDAPRREEVLNRIEYLGLIPVEAETQDKTAGLLQSLSSPESLWKTISLSKPKPRDVTVFARDLGILLKSGVRIHQALDLLSEQEMTGPLAPAVAALRARIGAGESFADALSHEPALFPDMFVSLVRIGEGAGNLPNIMEALAEERTRLEALRRKATDSLRYPAFILTAATAVLLFFLLFVLPQFASVLKDLGSRVDPILATLMSVSDYVRANGSLLGPIALATILILGLLFAQKSIRMKVVAGFMRLPGLRDLSRDYRTALFCRNLGLQLGNGVKLTTALGLVAQAVQTGDPEHWRPAIEKVRQGGRLADALTLVDLLSPVAVRMLRLGEEAGHLAGISMRAADLFEVRLERRLESLVAIIGPVSIIAIATIVGGLVISLMTSLISIGQLAN